MVRSRQICRQVRPQNSGTHSGLRAAGCATRAADDDHRCRWRNRALGGCKQLADGWARRTHTVGLHGGGRKWHGRPRRGPQRRRRRRPLPARRHSTDSFGHATHADTARRTNAVQYCAATAAWPLQCTPTLARRLTVIACASVFLVGSCSPYWRCQRRRLCSSRPAPRCRRLWRPRWRPRRR